MDGAMSTPWLSGIASFEDKGELRVMFTFLDWVKRCMLLQSTDMKEIKHNQLSKTKEYGPQMPGLETWFLYWVILDKLFNLSLAKFSLL